MVDSKKKKQKQQNLTQKRSLETIYGIGKAKARIITNANNEIQSVEDILKNDTYKNQKCAIVKKPCLLQQSSLDYLEYYEDLQKPIPKNDINHFKTELEKRLDKDTKFEIMGSYRRGKSESGDIDVMFIDTSTIHSRRPDKQYLQTILQLLNTNTATFHVWITLSSGSDNWKGIIKLTENSQAMRVDFFVTTRLAYPFAAIAHTGDADYNKKIRSIAKSKGFVLNHKGLRKIDTKDEDTHYIQTEFPTEESVFTYLGVKYKEPEKRIGIDSVEYIDHCKTIISYNQRKEGKVCDLIDSDYLKTYKDLEYDKSGIDYNSSEQIFDIMHKASTVVDKYANTVIPILVEYNYIYIISKTINKQLFFKIGSGSGGNNQYSKGRIGSAQTYLIPGLENIGFFIHFCILYRKEKFHNNYNISEHVEKNGIHKTLQTIFPASSISFANNNQSEWYLVQPREVSFFLGFVMDTLSSYSMTKLKPLQILKFYKDNHHNKVLEIQPPDTETIRKRIEILNNIKGYESIQSTLDEFNIRSARSIPDTVLSVEHNLNRYNSDMKKLKTYFMGEDKYVYIQQESFKVLFIRREINARSMKLTRKIVYVTLQNNPTDSVNPIQDFFKSHKIKFVESFIPNNPNPVYLLTISDFLKHVNKPSFANDSEKIEWDNLYAHYTSDDYIKSINIINGPDNIIPACYLDKKIQKNWATEIVSNDKHPLHTHWDDPYSNTTIEKMVAKYNEFNNLEDTEEQEEEQERLYSEFDKPYEWVIMRYEESNNTVMRQIKDREILEYVPVYKLMLLANLKDTMKNSLFVKQDQWEKIDSFTVNKVIYHKNDIVKINNDQFLFSQYEFENVPFESRLYKIKGIYNDKHSNAVLNPYIDIVSVEHKDDKYVNIETKIVYISVNESIISGKIELIEQSEKPEKLDIQYKIGNYLELTGLFDVPNTTDVYQEKLKGSKEHPHYVQIVSEPTRDKLFYGVHFFEPYKNQYSWGQLDTQTKSNDFIVYIDKYDIENKTNKIDDYDIIKQYIQKLPFLLFSVDRIIRYRKTRDEYEVEWNKPDYIDDDVISKFHPKKLIEEFAKDKLDDFLNSEDPEQLQSKTKTKTKTKTQKQKSPVTKSSKTKKQSDRNAFAFRNNLERSKNQWISIHNMNKKRERTTKSTYVYDLWLFDKTTKSIFKGGDIIKRDLSDDLGYIVNYYFDDNHSIIYGVYFIDETIDYTNATTDTHHYQEYTETDLVKVLPLSIDYLQTKSENVKLKKTYQSMFNRFLIIADTKKRTNKKRIKIDETNYSPIEDSIETKTRKTRNRTNKKRINIIANNYSPIEDSITDS
jgi:DNA polymerase/3'-5' exonuclease PolX